MIFNILEMKILNSIRIKIPKQIKELILKLYWPTKSVWEDIQDYAFEMIGHIPSHVLRIILYHYLSRVQIGKFSSIHRCCRLYRPNRIKIGNHTVINYGVLLDGRSGLRIGDNVSISEGSAILSLQHDIDDEGFELEGGEVVIEDYVFVGAHAMIMPKVRIGKGAVVGAGAVVTRDVEPYTVVGGVPARFIRYRTHDLCYQLNYRKRFG